MYQAQPQGKGNLPIGSSVRKFIKLQNENIFKHHQPIDNDNRFS